MDGGESGQRLVRVAVALGVAGLLGVVVVVGASLRTGPRPEEDAAADYVEAVFRGDAEATYAASAPAYRALVSPAEHAELVAALARVAGGPADVDVVGSERRSVTDPLRSLVGYGGETAAGPVEGVVTLVRPGDDWLVLDLSYEFAEASAGETAGLDEVTRRLNRQLRERAGRGATPAATPPD